MVEIDAKGKSVTEINRSVRELAQSERQIVISNPDARHLLCVGLLAATRVIIRGSAGYFCGGLSDGPTIEVLNNVGWGLGDNLMSGTIVVGQHAWECAGHILNAQQFSHAATPSILRTSGSPGIYASRRTTKNYTTCF